MNIVVPRPHCGLDPNRLGSESQTSTFSSSGKGAELCTFTSCIRPALGPLNLNFISWVWISLPDPCKKCSDWWNVWNFNYVTMLLIMCNSKLLHTQNSVHARLLLLWLLGLRNNFHLTKLHRFCKPPAFDLHKAPPYIPNIPSPFTFFVISNLVSSDVFDWRLTLIIRIGLLLSSEPELNRGSVTLCTKQLKKSHH